MEKVGEKSPDLSHDRLPDLVSRIVTPSPIQTGAGETAEPSTLAQMDINVANMDFT